MEIKLYAKHSVELYNQLANEIMRLIVNGIIKQGDRLPSVRHFATQLKVNPSTVQKAYQVLHDKGIIYVEPKKRAIVKQHLPTEDLLKKIEVQLIQTITEARASGLEKKEFETIVKTLLDLWR